LGTDVVNFARRNLSSPAKTNPSIILESPHTSDRLVLHGQSEDIEGTPVLVWENGHYRKDRAQSPAGWALYLAGGLPHFNLGFAHWDDEAGIADLVADMSDPEVLMVRAILTDLEEMQVFKIRRDLIEQYQGNPWKPLSLQKIRKVLISHGLATRYRSELVKRIEQLTVVIDKVPIPLATLIPIPTSYIPGEGWRTKSFWVEGGDLALCLGMTQNMVPRL
jgi:hypothetical protein